MKLKFFSIEKSKQKWSKFNLNDKFSNNKLDDNAYYDDNNFENFVSRPIKSNNNNNSYYSKYVRRRRIRESCLLELDKKFINNSNSNDCQQLRRRRHHHHSNYRQNIIFFKRKKCFFINLLSLSLMLFIFNLILLFMPILISSEYVSNSLLNSQQLISKNSGQFFISQLCAGKSQFPVTKRVEGAVLTSIGDSDINCTVTFRTKSAQQHFAIRFEELKLGCDDHLKMFDGDLDYGQPSIKDFSCKDNLASVPLMKTTGTFLTLRFSTDSRTHKSDGFKLILTAIFDTTLNWDCPADYSYCQNRLCISRSLFCDDVNHCLDNSDEIDCSSRFGLTGSRFNDNSLSLSSSTSSSSSIFYDIGMALKNPVILLVLAVIIIIAVISAIVIVAKCLDNYSPYNQYQHHLQRTIGVPLQSSASLMFANHHQLQYQYFQPANLSPYVTPQHHATLTSNSTLPRGYSTLPLNLARANPQQQQQQQQQYLQQLQLIQHQNHQPLQQLQTSKQQQQQLQNSNNNTEYLMMAGLTQPTALQPTPTIQTNLFLPTSQSILATHNAGIRYQQTPLVKQPQPTPMMPQQQQQQQQQSIIESNQLPTQSGTPQQESRR